jgi:hypothetical protein
MLNLRGRLNFAVQILFEWNYSWFLSENAELGRVVCFLTSTSEEARLKTSG